MCVLKFGSFNPGLTPLAQHGISLHIVRCVQRYAVPITTYLELDMEVITKLDALLEVHAGTRVNGRVASNRTHNAARDTLRAGFRRLHAIQYKIADPVNFAERHMQALSDDWHERGLSPKTIQGYLSQFRIFCGWIGKKGLVKDIHHYLPDVPKAELRVKNVADKSKSWAETGIDVAQKVREAQALDPRFGLMILLQVAFGLRRKEVLQMQPWKVDRNDRFAATETKGHRPRDIYIDTPVQRAALDMAKEMIKGKNDTVGWTERKDGKAFKGNRREASFQYSSDRYDYLMQRLGISKAVSACTGHGLRAQFAENAALLKDLIPPTLGGTGGQKPRGDIDVVRLQVSEALGHSRLSVTGAYYGSFGREGALDGPGRAKDAIETCFKTVTLDQVKPIPHARIAECTILAAEVMAIGVYDDPRKIQLLWEHHSRRHAVEWLQLADGPNLAALEAAALSITRAADRLSTQAAA
jgi:site-specific recombinase XerD